MGVTTHGFDSKQGKMHSPKLTWLLFTGKAKFEICRVLMRFCEVLMKYVKRLFYLYLANFSPGCEFFWFHFKAPTQILETTQDRQTAK